MSASGSIERLPVAGVKVTAIDGQYSVYFACTGSVGFAIEDPFEVHHAGELIVVDPCHGVPELSEVRRVLLGERVAYVEYDAEEVLTVSFEAGAWLRVTPNTDGYESWNVNYPPDRIVIGSGSFAGNATDLRSDA